MVAHPKLTGTLTIQLQSDPLHPPGFHTANKAATNKNDERRPVHVSSRAMHKPSQSLTSLLQLELGLVEIANEVVVEPDHIDMLAHQKTLVDGVDITK